MKVTMTNVILDSIGKFWKSSIMAGVLAVIVGCLIAAWPDISLAVAAVLFGVYMLLSGAVQGLAAIVIPLRSAGYRALLFLSGGVSLVLGLLCFRNELNSLLLLALWVGIGWIFQGITTLVPSISEESFPGRGWQIFAGVVITLGGMVIIIWPLNSIVALALVVAIWLIGIGVIQIVGGIGIRSAMKKTENDSGTAGT